MKQLGGSSNDYFLSLFPSSSLEENRHVTSPHAIDENCPKCWNNSTNEILSTTLTMRKQNEISDCDKIVHNKWNSFHSMIFSLYRRQLSSSIRLISMPTAKTDSIRLKTEFSSKNHSRSSIYSFVGRWWRAIDCVNWFHSLLGSLQLTVFGGSEDNGNDNDNETQRDNKIIEMIKW